MGKTALILGLCVLSLAGFTRAFGQDANTAEVAPALLEAAGQARADGNTAQAVELIQALNAQCAGTEEALRGLLMMAEMSILGEVADSYRAEAYQGVLAFTGTDKVMLTLRYQSLGWFANLDAANNWQLHWQCVEDNAHIDRIRGKAFVTLVKTAQDIQGKDVMWALLDRAKGDKDVKPAWRKNVDSLLRTIEKEEGADVARATAIEIAARYPDHSMSYAAFWYAWELAGRTGGEEAQIALLKAAAAAPADTGLRRRAIRRLSDHYVYQNDIAGAVAATMLGVEKTDLFSQPVSDIRAASAALAEHLQTVADKVPWDGERTADAVLAKLADSAAAAGLDDVSAALSAPTDQ
jgi:hypothetical protein